MRLAQWSNIHRKPEYRISNIFNIIIITAMLFVENASMDYYVTNEKMKRGYLFDIMLSLVSYVFCYIKKIDISFNILLLLYGFTGLSKNCWRQNILKEWLSEIDKLVNRNVCFSFLLNIISCACNVASGLKFIFH